MLNDEVIEKVIERLVNRIEQGNTYVLEQIGESINKIGTLSPSKAQQLEQVLKYGGDYDKIVKKLAEITKLNVKDIYDIFEEVAKNDYQFAKQFYVYRNKKFIPYEENIALKRQVKALAKIAAKEYVNLSATRILGFGWQDEEGNVVFKGLRKTYEDVIDKAILSISQGKTTFQDEMYRTIKELGGSGLKTISEKTYIDKNGVEKHYTRRLDSSIRMNIKDALRNLHNEEQKIFGKEFDSDGVEISVHLKPAPDHQYVQGRQFSNEEFEKFQNDEDCVDYQGREFAAEYEGHDRRSIGQYNCYHYIFSIVLGVSEPEYSNEKLKEIIDKNNEGFDYEGKHYTMYEGTQLQRKLETEIRKQKDIQIMGRAAGESGKENVLESQEKITILTRKYKELSEASGLPTKMQRLRVSDYKRVKVELKNYNEIKYARKNNAIWHTTENLEEIIKSDKVIAPSIAVAKGITTHVQYGTQFIEFKPEILEKINKNTILYKGDGGNQYSKNNKYFDNLMNMLKDTPKDYNEIKFNEDLKFSDYIKKVYVRQDEPKEVINLLKENNIDYEIYKDYRIRGFKKKR